MRQVSHQEGCRCFCPVQDKQSRALRFLGMARVPACFCTPMHLPALVAGLGFIGSDGTVPAPKGAAGFRARQEAK